MASIRALHMAKNLEELNKKTPSSKIKQASPKVLCKTAEKIFLKARDARLQDGDEEEAYVLFMRFLDVVSYIRKSREYKSNKKEFDKLLPSTRFTQAIEEAEKLSQHLQERYSELSEPADKKPRYDDDAQPNLDTSHVVPSSPGKVLSAEQLYKQSKPLLPQQSSTPGNLDVGWFGNQSSTSLLDTLPPSTSSLPTISPEQLYECLQNSPDDVLVLDCRPRREYVASHVDAKRFQQWLCVPEETVKRGVCDSNISTFLPPAGKKHWMEREKKRWIVLVDDASTTEKLSGSDNVPILILKDAIHKWDTTVQNEPFILDGGYAKWHLTYAPLCVGSYRRKEGSSVEVETSTKSRQQESLDYPSFPTMSEPATQDEEPASKEEEKIAINGVPPEPAAVNQHDTGTEDDPTGDTDQTNRHGGQENALQSPPPAPIVHAAPLLPTITPTPQILPGYMLPPPSTIPVALTLEGESALLTPTLSTDDDILADVPELDASLPNGSLPSMQYVQVPLNADAGIPLPSQQHNFHEPQTVIHPLPPEGVQQLTQYPVEAVPTNNPQSYPHQSVAQEQGYLPQPMVSSHAVDHHQPMSQQQMQEQGYLPQPMVSSHAVDHHQPMSQQQMQEQGYLPQPMVSSHAVDHHQPMSQQQTQEQGYLPQTMVVHPSLHTVGHHQPIPQQQMQESGYPPQVMVVHPSLHTVDQHQPMSRQEMQEVYSADVNHPQSMPRDAQYQGGYNAYPSNCTNGHVFQFQGQSPQYFAAPYSHTDGIVPAPLSQMVQPHPPGPPVQPHPPGPPMQPHPHGPPMQPHPPGPPVQPHPPGPPVQPHPHGPPMQSHPHGPPVQQHHPHGPPMQPHPPDPAMQPHPPQTLQPAVSAPTTSSVQNYGPPPATQQVTPGRMHFVTPQVAPQSSPDQLPNQRVVNGPIPNPPSYDESHRLPSCPPVQPPMPPPVSLTQPNELARADASVHPQREALTTEVATQRHAEKSSELLEKEARIQELERRLVEREKEAQLKRTTERAMEDLKLQQENEKRDLLVKQRLESERAKLLDEVEQEKEALRSQLQQEKARQAHELEQQRQALALERDQHERQVAEKQRQVDEQQRQVAEQQQQLQQMKLQFEREKVMVEQQQKEILQHLQLRKQKEHERMFSVSQGMPPGWEKRLDSGTGRFYYVDHSTKTTHWSPPTNWLAYQAELQRQKELQEQQRVMQQGPEGKRYAQPQVQVPGTPQVVPGQVPPGSSPVVPIPRPQPPASVPRPSPQPQQAVPPSSLQTVPVQLQPGRVGATQQPVPTPTSGIPVPPQPTIPQPLKTGTKAAIPVVDRSTKPADVAAQRPASVPVIDRSKKPVMTPSMHRRKLESLQPVFGSQGYVLTGLRNLGNTCFMNSMIQCLCCTIPLTEQFLNGSFWSDINRTNPLGRGGKVAEEFAFLVKVMWSGQYRSVSPRDFKTTICSFAPQFAGNAQQDAQELLAFLMDGLHEDLNRIKLREVSEPRDFSGMPDTQIAKLSWEDHRKRNDSIIIDWFQGQFRSTVVCLRCKNRSVTFEAFMYLSLPIPPGSRPYTLKDCIQLFTKEERVTGRDRWYCSKCKGHQDAIKKIEIWKLPRILIVCLKRFLFEGVWREKRQNDVDFPLSSLDMTPHVVGVRPPGLYKLYAVSNHYGTMTGGHYTAFCMNPYKRRFYCFDDHEVKDVRNVRSNGAYVLFYTAIDFPTPRML